MDSATEAETFLRCQLEDCRIWVDPMSGTALGTKDRLAVAARIAAYGSATTVGDFYAKHPGGSSPLGDLSHQDLCLGFLSGDILYHPQSTSRAPRSPGPRPSPKSPTPPKKPDTRSSPKEPTKLAQRQPRSPPSA